MTARIAGDGPGQGGLGGPRLAAASIGSRGRGPRRQASEPSILIVGAGPVGLSLAIELARHGIRPRIIDMTAEPSIHCRAVGVSPRTLEVFEAMGVVREIIAAGLQITGRRSILHRGTDVAVHDEVIELDDLPYAHFGVPQNRTEAVLADRLAQIGITVERECRLNGLVQDEEGVTVEVERRGQAQDRGHCDFVVGCDGAHSAVRKLAGIGFEGEAFPYDFMLGDVAVAWDLPRGRTLQAIRPVTDGPPDFFVAIPLPERGRYRVSMMAPRQAGIAPGADGEHGIQSQRTGPSLADIQHVADRLLPGRPRLSELRWSSIFRISMRLAERYRSGRLLLAGDACHIHPPTGGQGMNTGIQDAFNLAWKLALVARGHAAPALLDSYEQERRPVAAAVIEDTVCRSVNLGKPAGARNRLDDTQMLVSYANGPLARGEAAHGLKPGARMPDIQGLRRRGVGFPLRLFDLAQGPWLTLFAFLPDGALAGFESLAAQLEADWPGLLRMLAVLPARQALDDPPGITVVEDAGGRAGKLFGDRDSRLLLLRPDGHIGFIGLVAAEPLFACLSAMLPRMPHDCQGPATS